ncbi:MAG TPA: SAM-dependent methyltransferase, partial [Aggregatilineaceae bacterium]|nr:SAM-dependent methyltransferase [Aggregatilineaceae bacterium]
IRQMVILGAGLDTRPYRLNGMDQVKVFEVDLPSVQNEKKKQIQKHFGQLPKNVSFVPIDFDTQALETVFADSAFDSSQPAVFIWEGVTQYISEAAVLKTLAFIGQSAPGSLLIFTYVLKSVIERRSSIDGADKIMDRVSKGNAPWVFGLKPADVPPFLKPFHLKLIADVGSADYQARYLKPLGRNLVVSQMERVVQAVVRRP